MNDLINSMVIVDGNAVLTLIFNSIYAGRLDTCLDEPLEKRKIVSKDDVQNYTMIMSREFHDKTDKCLGFDNIETKFNRKLFERVRLDDGKIGYRINARGMNDDSALQRLHVILDILMTNYSKVINESSKKFRSYYDERPDVTVYDRSTKAKVKRLLKGVLRRNN